MLQAVRGVAGEHARLVDRQRPLPRDVAIDADPLDELHDEEVEVAGLPLVVRGHDVLVLEAGRGAHLLVEPLGRPGLGRQVRGHHLQRHHAVHHRVVG
ncbi:MAG TPA: hypothetical protein VM529_20785, partial [Gemmata sp.]|nr:hypothetical protein [Gemmata sp.]